MAVNRKLPRNRWNLDPGLWGKTKLAGQTHLKRLWNDSEPDVKCGILELADSYLRVVRGNNFAEFEGSAIRKTGFERWLQIPQPAWRDTAPAIRLQLIVLSDGPRFRYDASFAQHPPVRHGQVNEKNGREEDPACGDMESSNAFRKAVIPEHHQ
jgi:hypothetical protein